MAIIEHLKKSFGLRLLLYMVALLLASGLCITVPSFFIAKSELDHKGEMILKNSVESAIQLINAKQEAVACGQLTSAQAQEQVKEILTGPKLANGTRAITTKIDLGKDGYFIVYSLDGTEIMHPSLEGQNVWAVQSKGRRPYALVQDQILKARQGGGFSYYSWELPHQKQVGEKVSYAMYDPKWQWVVVATAYLKDYNAGASDIVKVMATMTTLLLILGGGISYRYVRHAMRPIKAVAGAMSQAEQGHYRPLNIDSRKDEIGTLVNGFNRMVLAIDQAYQALKAQQLKADFYAYYDKASGLPNMNKLTEHVGERMACMNAKGQLILMQVDTYDHLINLYGTAYGEDLMCRIGTYISSFQMGDNRIARIATNEFAGWVEQWSEAELNEQLLQLKIALNAEIEQWGFGRLIEYSIGYSQYPVDGKDFETCYQRAAIALMHAKKTPSRILGFEETHFKVIDLEARMTAAAEAELNASSFYPVYQGKFDEVRQQFTGVEALARWQSETFGMVSPATFIPLLTKAGLMNRFSEAMLEKVIAEVPKIREAYGETIRVSVNLPHEFFYREDLTVLIKRMLVAHQVPPETLMLEITEDSFIQATDFIADQVNALRAMGVGVSLDDFGTGYSSLNYLTKIQFDEIKIDKSFIDDLLTDDKARALLKHIVGLAETFDTSVVAEGVETTDQVAVIKALGCHIIQGYVYSKPTKL